MMARLVVSVGVLAQDSVNVTEAFRYFLKKRGGIVPR